MIPFFGVYSLHRYLATGTATAPIVAAAATATTTTTTANVRVGVACLVTCADKPGCVLMGKRKGTWPFCFDFLCEQTFYEMNLLFMHYTTLHNVFIIVYR